MLVVFGAARGELARGGTLADLDAIADCDGVAWDVHFVAVHEDVSVGDELAGGGACACDAEEVDDVVKACVEETEEIFAGDAALAFCAGECEAELFFIEPYMKRSFCFSLRPVPYSDTLRRFVGPCMPGE